MSVIARAIIRQYISDASWGDFKSMRRAFDRFPFLAGSWVSLTGERLAQKGKSGAVETFYYRERFGNDNDPAEPGRV